MTYEEIDALRLKAFMTNGDADRKAYFDGASKWFQDEVFRRMDRAAELATLRAENERLREALVKAGSLADINTDGSIDCALKWVSDIAKEVLK